MSTIGIVGGSGFVGKHLTEELTGKGHTVIIFSREAGKQPVKSGITYASFDYKKKVCDTDALGKLDAIVNLAGAGIADKRWTEERKKEITSSRVDNTLFLLSQLKDHAQRCKAFIVASAIGFYGEDNGKQPFTENAPADPGFLGDTCQKWEKVSFQGTSFMRTVILRFGIVLGKESGAFPKFLQPMQLGVKPILGDGRQIVSWIEVSDLARLICFALENNKISGTYNAVAPAPVSNKQLMDTIGEIKGGMKIPVPVPAFALKAVMGEMSVEVLKSCTVSAGKITRDGFEFNFPSISSAVIHILK